MAGRLLRLIAGMFLRSTETRWREGDGCKGCDGIEIKSGRRGVLKERSASRIATRPTAAKSTISGHVQSTVMVMFRFVFVCSLIKIVRFDISI
jgi:hypothetical protein